MKRNLLLLAVMAAFVVCFTSQSFAQQDPNDLGLPDSIIILTCPDDHTYEADPGSFDSVRVCVYVTHDSNTFYWVQNEIWVQDSVAAFVVPLVFWHQPEGTADSVIFPTWDYWNNDAMSPYLPWINRSMFRHGCSGEDVKNRMLEMVEAGKTAWNVYTDFEEHSCEGDSGRCSFSVVPMSPGCQRWWEGSRVLLATLTFHVYMAAGADTTEIGIDSTFWPPQSQLTFTRHDAVVYFPQHNLFVKDTIYIVPCLDPDITCPDPETQHVNGSFTTATKFNASAGNPPGDDGDMLTSVTAVSGCANITIVSVNVDPPGLPANTATGTVTYNVVNHCDPGCDITLTATNDCSPPKTDDCTFSVGTTNGPPSIVCPGNMTQAYNQKFVSGNFTTSDPDGDAVTVGIAVAPAPANAPTVVGSHVEWDATCADVSITYTVTLTPTDVCGLAGTPCTFTMHATNTPPTITCPVSSEDVVEGALWTSATAFSASDTEEGDLTGSVGYVSIAPDFGEAPYICATDRVCWFPTATTPDGDYTITLDVFDECGLSATCDFVVHKTSKAPGTVEIPNLVYERFGFGHWDYFEPDNYIILDDACPPYYGINPGDYFEIPIILEDPTVPGTEGIGSFHFEVEFDYVDLTFFGADRGGLLSERYEVDGVLYSWEYFSYRLCPCAFPGCLKYKIEIFGQAEMPDGLFRLGYCLNSGYIDPQTTPGFFWYVDQYVDDAGEKHDIGATLVWLKFQVANNQLLRDLKLPIEFEWDHKLCWDPDLEVYYICQDWDCAENTMGDCSGEVLFVSKDPMQYDPDICGDPEQYPPEEILNFIDGGVHICSPCTAFKCVRGDINLNHIAYDPADPVLLSRAIIFGEEVVFWELAEQICASDVNADGRGVMLADLIYLIRVIQNDAIPYPKLGPSSDVATLIVSDDRISVECASAIGGLLFVFDGAVTPTLLNTEMELLSHEGRVLVWSRDGNSINAGVSEVLSVTGADLVSVTAVDRESRDLATTITTKVAPSAFALHNAYPNPFNPNTNLSFTLPNATAYRLNIYNVAGQLVRSYDGMGTAGLNVVSWNGKDNAGNDVSSGVYFFKLSAGIYNATSKMVLMK
jgi:hypothetical protein